MNKCGCGSEAEHMLSRSKALALIPRAKIKKSRQKKKEVCGF
jgi:hypothetical protein